MGRRARMRKLREEDLEELLEQLEPEAASAAPKAEQAAAPVEKALELQKTAGNRAVGAALHRWSLPFVPQAQIAQWPKEARAVFDGKLVVPIKSVSDLAQNQAVGGRSGQAPHGDPEGEGELVIVAAIGDHMIELHKATAMSKVYGKVEIILPGPNGTGVRYELENVYITSYQTGGDPHHPGGVQSYQLSFSKRKFSHAPPPPR